MYSCSQVFAVKGVQMPNLGYRECWSEDDLDEWDLQTWSYSHSDPEMFVFLIVVIDDDGDEEWELLYSSWK